MDVYKSKDESGKPVKRVTRLGTYTKHYSISNDPAPTIILNCYAQVQPQKAYSIGDTEDNRLKWF